MITLTIILILFGTPLTATLVLWLFGARYIPHERVGIVEKLWSPSGPLSGGRIIALSDRAGYQCEVLRGGIHFGYYPWQYRVHKVPLVLIGEGKIGYVYSRDGEALAPTQTLGSVVDCNSFQDARAFLEDGGQRGRQRGILREGLYAINLALFVVLDTDRIYSGPILKKDSEKFGLWQRQLRSRGGFRPVLVGQGGQQMTDETDREPEPGDTELSSRDTIGVVTVHDGPPIAAGEIIAPEVKATDQYGDHSYFQDPEVFLALGGHRGKQLQVLTDGTFFINRWFATVEIHRKTLIPIGYVGAVVSYHGVAGEDVTGDGFRYGEQVDSGHRGVWKNALPPGKYPLNPYALRVELVPTVNFVLRWITGRVESHQYDEELKSIEIITADGYEPALPLSLVLHIDYEKAPRVIQRFGDVKRLISQTLDPILSSYFRDVAQSSNMLDLLTRRDEIQKAATAELRLQFREFDINCIAVLIGRPESKQKGPEDPIERLFDQLRQRRLAKEQQETFARQKDAADKLRQLNDAQAAAERQTELTRTELGIEIAANEGKAALAGAKRLARRDIERARGKARSRKLIGLGEAARIAKTGLAEASVFEKKIDAYQDPRLFALSLVARALSRSQQPLVPERLMVTGKNGDDQSEANGLWGPLLALLLSERSGVEVADGGMGSVPSAPSSLESTIPGGA